VLALVAALAHLAVALAPLAEARDSRNPRAHVEESTGTRCQYVHNEAACAACSATHLLSRVERPCTVVPPAVRQHATVTAAPPRPTSARYFSSRTSRAPPLVV
jgi:hypothetical protein